DLYLYTSAQHRSQHVSDYQPVAVAYDGAPRHHQTALRTRTRTIPAQLAQLGWRNTTLWAIDVFTDPIGITDSYADLLQLPQQTETTETSPVDSDLTVATPQNTEEELCPTTTTTLKNTVNNALGRPPRASLVGQQLPGPAQ